MSIGISDVAPRTPIGRGYLPAARWLLGLLVIGSITAAGVDLGRGVVGSAAKVDWAVLAAAFAVAVGYRVANAAAWGLVLASLGLRLPTPVATRIWLRSEACRWLPGGIWNLGSRAALASRAGLPAAGVGVSLGLELIVTIASWAMVALVGLCPNPETLELARSRLLGAGPGQLGVIGLVAAAVLAVGGVAAWTSPRLATKGRAAIDRVLGALRVRSRAIPMGAALASYTLLGAVNGLAFLGVIRAVAPDSGVPVLAAIGVNAAAWLIGFFAVFAPGGLVVREGAAAALLVAWLPIEQGLVAATLWRLVQVASELACLAPMARWRPGARRDAIGAGASPDPGPRPAEEATQDS